MITRLEKKCFVGSAMFHTLLLAVFFLGSAFMGSKKSEPLPPVITMLALPTDRPISSGGSPKGNPDPPAPAPQPRMQQPVVQPPPQPVREVRRVEPEPPKPTPRREVVKETPPPKIEVPTKVPEPKRPVAKPQDTAALRDLTNNVVTRSRSDARAAADRTRARQIAAQRAADSKARAQQKAIANAVNGIIDGVGKSLSSSTVVEPLGPGGAAFVNYGSLVREVYDRAWIVPPSLTDDDSTARAEVIIARDGRVISARITRRSGHPVLDKSVDRALDAVKTVAPFPEGTTDARRTFTINFNLRTKRFSS